MFDQRLSCSVNCEVESVVRKLMDNLVNVNERTMCLYILDKILMKLVIL
jgi:hypothetical protein